MRLRRPGFAGALALVWIAVHVLALDASGWPPPPGGRWLAFGSPDPDVLLRFGALVSSRVHLGEWQRLLTHAFLHASVLHLLFAVWVGLWAAGSLGRVIGAWRAWTVFVAGVLTAAALHLVLTAAGSGPPIALGAWGGVYGLVGALALWAFTNRDPAARAARGGIVFFLVIVAAFTLLLDRSGFGEFGGLGGGVLAMALFGPRRAPARPAGAATRALAVVLALLTVGAGIAQFARADAAPREDLAPLFAAIEAMERDARGLYRRPRDATPEKRAALEAKIAAIEASPALPEGEARTALHAYLDAWRPVARGDVPDPFAFERSLETARQAWRAHERRLRAASGLTRGL